MTVTLHDRCIAYTRAFPQWPDSWPYVSPTGRWVYGHWYIGSLFRNETRYYGAYPRTYAARVRALFPEVRSDAHVLHLFSGSLPKGRYTRLDNRPEPMPGIRPELVGNVYDLTALLAARRVQTPIKLIMADPPYSAEDSAKYEQRPLDRARAMRSIAAAVEPGTQLAWLDTQVPMYRADQWQCWGDIDVFRSTNQRRRSVTLFERKAS